MQKQLMCFPGMSLSQSFLQSSSFIPGTCACSFPQPKKCPYRLQEWELRGGANRFPTKTPNNPAPDNIPRVYKVRHPLLYRCGIWYMVYGVPCPILPIECTRCVILCHSHRVSSMLDVRVCPVLAGCVAHVH